MRKLEPVDIDAVSFVGDIISSSGKRGESQEETKKATDEFRSRCSAIVSTNEQTIKQYDDDFASNSLENLENKGQLSDVEKSDFLSLYSYQKKQIAHLRNEVLTQNGFINEDCPLCECDSVSTMDHYLPKEQYPLFVVHPRNLIPCCNSCNQHKSVNVFKNGERVFWNCYLDNPINTRYLYCTISTKDGLLTGKFSIDVSGLSEQEAIVVENTMGEKGQSVLAQYNKKVGNEIKEMVKRISDLMLKGDGFDDSVRKIKEVDLPSHILNDWKEVLKEALLNSDAFLDFAKEEAEKIVEKMWLEYKSPTGEIKECQE